MLNKFIDLERLTTFFQGLKDIFLQKNEASTTYATKNEVSNKVDKIEGYGLSKNDFTDELITKLNGIEEEANKVEIVNNLEETLTGKALDAYQGYLLSQSLDTVFQNVDSGKGLVANAIIDKGGSGVSNDSTFQELANGVINIKSGGEIEANLVNSGGEFGFNGDLIIPSEIDGISVTSIGDGIFNGRVGLTSVTLPNSLTSIGFYAFTECTGLTSVIIPNSVIAIYNGAFSYCSNLATAYIPEGLDYPTDAFPTTTNIIEYTPGGADDPTIGN